MSAYRESCDACMNRKIRDDADGKVQPTRAWHTSTRNRFLAWLIGALVFTFSTAALIDAWPLWKNHTAINIVCIAMVVLLAATSWISSIFELFDGKDDPE